MGLDTSIIKDEQAHNTIHGGESSTDSALVNWVYNEFQKAVDYFSTELERENISWKMYSGQEHGQWNPEAYSKLVKEGRHANQYNLIKNKVESLAGYFLNNLYDVDFVPVDGRYSDLTQLLKKLFYSDRELMSWNNSYLKFVIDYLIHCGTEEMIISTRYSPFGNIGFERVMPGHLIVDPTWVTDCGWDLKIVWKVAYLDAQQIKQRYSVDEDVIDAQINLINMTGQQYIGGDFEVGNIPNKDLNTSYGTKWRVIEQHEIRREKKEIEVVMDQDGTVHEVPDIDNDAKREWAILNQIDFSAGVMSRKIDVNNYYRTSTCRELLPTVVLEEVKPIIQIGRLPFFRKSSARINGRDSGLVEVLMDVQQTINKRESLIDAMIANSASGAKMIDPSIVGNDVEALKELKLNYNNPSYTGLSKPGEIASGRKHVEEFPRTQFPQDMINELNRMWEVADRISKSPAAWDARNEGSNINGVLFARMSKQAEVNSTVQMMGLESHWHDKGEAYMLLSKLLYAGIYREFKDAGAKEDNNPTIKVNDTQNTQDGKQVTLNDISKLPRHKVIVSQSPQGVNNRETDRELNSELLRVIPGQNPVSRALAVRNVMKTLPTSTQERKEFEAAASIEFELAMSSATAQVSQFKAQQAQAEAQVAQMQNPQPQQAPQGQGQGQPRQQGKPQQGQLQQPDQQPQPIQQTDTNIPASK